MAGRCPPRHPRLFLSARPEQSYGLDNPREVPPSLRTSPGVERTFPVQEQLSPRHTVATHPALPPAAPCHLRFILFLAGKRVGLRAKEHDILKSMRLRANEQWCQKLLSQPSWFTLNESRCERHRRRPGVRAQVQSPAGAQGTAWNLTPQVGGPASARLWNRHKEHRSPKRHTSLSASRNVVHTHNSTVPSPASFPHSGRQEPILHLGE